MPGQGRAHLRRQRLAVAGKAERLDQDGAAVAGAAVGGDFKVLGWRARAGCQLALEVRQQGLGAGIGGIGGLAWAQGSKLT